jgi:tellurite resistance protein
MDAHRLNRHRGCNFLFVDNLRPDQQQALFDLAVQLAGADGTFSEEEKRYLNAYMAHFGIEADFSRAEQHSLEELAEAFDTPESRVIALQQLIRLGYKDGHFSEEEREKVLALAQKLGLNDPEFILRVERWVRTLFDWFWEGEQMIEEAAQAKRC